MESDDDEIDVYQIAIERAEHAEALLAKAISCIEELSEIHDRGIAREAARAVLADIRAAEEERG